MNNFQLCKFCAIYKINCNFYYEKLFYELSTLIQNMLEHPVVFPFLRSSTDNDTRGRSKTLFPVEMGLNLFQFCANFYESELEWPPNSLCQHQSNAYVLYYNLSDVSIMEYIDYEFLPLLQCFFCVDCRSQICHTVPFNWKALGSKMPFCHPVALMLWII